MVEFDEGRESEWNEASFKSKRLHDIQELINYFKMNPKAMTQGQFHYYWLARNIEALYGEGQSKYADSEKTKCKELLKLIHRWEKLCPPHTKYVNNTFSGNTIQYKLNIKNYEYYLKLLEDLEMLVKDLNDKHGLTSKNKDYGGMF